MIGNREKDWGVVIDTTKIQLFKQITTQRSTGSYPYQL